MKPQKLYPTDYNLLVVQDLWETDQQIWLIILPKEFIKLNVNMDMIVKKSETCRIKHKDCQSCFQYRDIKI